jgi:hypothetical protein
LSSTTIKAGKKPLINRQKTPKSLTVFLLFYSISNSHFKKSGNRLAQAVVKHNHGKKPLINRQKTPKSLTVFLLFYSISNSHFKKSGNRLAQAVSW